MSDLAIKRAQGFHFCYSGIKSRALDMQRRIWMSEDGISSLKMFAAILIKEEGRIWG